MDRGELTTDDLKLVREAEIIELTRAEARALIDQWTDMPDALMGAIDVAQADAGDDGLAFVILKIRGGAI